MPKVDGLTVMERVGKDSNLKKHPAFIVVSAVGQEQITEDAFFPWGKLLYPQAL